MSIESKMNFSNKSPESEIGSEISLLWQEFGFPTKPPKEGTPVEQRLIDRCKEYVRYVANPRLLSVAGSDSKRRDLHSEIAVMVMGQSREDMDIETAERITDFASRVALGCSIEEASEMYKDVA